ncbi:hypothetical protein A2U01_0118950, partial [Trifolium medium]|nr:hypothetical protein [Trifolium medium]
MEAVRDTVKIMDAASELLNLRREEEYKGHVKKMTIEFEIDLK